MRSAQLVDLRRSLRKITVLAALGGMLHSGFAFACQTDDDCKWPRLCNTSGVCADPTVPAPASVCHRDKDCPGASVCENLTCVPSNSTSQATASPPPNSSALEISPLRPAEPAPQQAAPSPEPPVQSGIDNSTPAIIPPALQERPPAPPPPSELPGSSHKRDVLKTRRSNPPPKFAIDVFAGVAYLASQAATYTTSSLGGAVDAQVLVGIADNVELGVRGSASIMPITSLYSVGPAVFMPDWHWGIMAGASNEGLLGGKREWGGEANLLFEYPLWSFIKMGGVAGAGIYKDAFEYSLRGEVGF